MASPFPASVAAPTYVPGPVYRCCLKASPSFLRVFACQPASLTACIRACPVTSGFICLLARMHGLNCWHSSPLLWEWSSLASVEFQLELARLPGEAWRATLPLLHNLASFCAWNRLPVCLALLHLNWISVPPVCFKNQT
jgi:hypothetical protein